MAFVVVVAAVVYGDVAQSQPIDWVGGIGGSWQTASNWDPARVPTGTDIAYLQGNERAVLNGNTASLNGLQVVSGASIYTNNFVINVDQSFLAISGEGARIRVDMGGGIDSREIVLQQGGKLEMNGGTAISDTVLTVAQISGSPIKGVIQGFGTVGVGEWINLQGRLQATGGTLLVGPSIANAVIDLDGDEEATYFGDVVVSGNSTLTVNLPLTDPFDGTMTVNANGHLNFNAGFDVGDNGDVAVNGELSIDSPVASQELWSVDGLLRLSPNGIVSGRLTPIVTQNGLISGSGYLQSGVVVELGALSPGGDTAGTIRTAFAYLQSTSTLEVTVGSYLRKLSADDLLIIGDIVEIDDVTYVSPGGNLEIDFDPLFSPQLDDSFDILDFGQLLGEFSSISLPALPMGMSWDTTSLYSTGVISIGVTGDYNGDGMVDAADYTVWRDGSPAADGNGDGAIDAADYTLWANNYGASASSATSAVPEPSTLLIGALGLPLLRRRGLFSGR